MADFLRISPWSADEVRSALRGHQVNHIVTEAVKAGVEPVIYLNIDDSLGEKDKATRHIEVVDWHHDHSESTKRRPRHKNGFCYLVCTMRIGSVVVTVDVRLYLRQKTVRRLNRRREKGNPIPFRSKYRLARLILEQLRPLLPQGWQVVVQFDSWYASARLVKYCCRHGWQVILRLRSGQALRLETQSPARWQTH